MATQCASPISEYQERHIGALAKDISLWVKLLLLIPLLVTIFIPIFRFPFPDTLLCAHDAPQRFQS